MTICRVWKNEIIDRQAMIEILNEFRDQHLSDTGAYDFKVWEPLDGPPMIVYGEAYFNDYAGLDKMKAWLETEKGMDFIQRFSKTAKVVDRLVIDQIL